MGQLEKYGLYVLCLVIFLILGVTIWGGDLPDANRVRNAARTPDLNAGAAGRSTAGSALAPTPSVDALLDLGAGGPVGAKEANAGKSGSGRPGTDVPAPSPVIEVNPVKVPGPSEARATHKVVAGDSFASIARKHFGTEAAAAELQRINPGVNANRLQVGTTLQLPSKAEVERAVPSTRPAGTATGSTAGSTAGSTTGTATGTAGAGGSGTAPAPQAGNRTYTVAAGDTFEGIALRQLGSRGRVDELRELNSSIDPTRLRVGMQIRLPKK